MGEREEKIEEEKLEAKKAREGEEKQEKEKQKGRESSDLTEVRHGGLVAGIGEATAD